MTKDELIKLYNMDLSELLEISSKYVSNNVEFCSIVNARNGKCSQNCRYCAQSSHYNTDIETHPLLSVDTVVSAAQDSVKNGADRVAIVTSGKTPDESDFDTMLDIHIKSGEGSCWKRREIILQVSLKRRIIAY